MKDIPLQEKYKIMSDDKNNCDRYIKFHFTRTINIKKPQRQRHQGSKGSCKKSCIALFTTLELE